MAFEGKRILASALFAVSMGTTEKAEAQTVTSDEIHNQQIASCDEISQAGYDALRADAQAYESHREDGDTVALALDRLQVATEYRSRVTRARLDLIRLVRGRIYIFGSAQEDVGVLDSCVTWTPSTESRIPDQSPTVLPPIGKK